MGASSRVLLGVLCAAVSAAGISAGPVLPTEQDSVRSVRTFDWHAGDPVRALDRVLSEAAPSLPGAGSRGGGPGPEGRRLSDDDAIQMDEEKTLQSLWDRPAWRDSRFSLAHGVGEHPCFAGYESMVHDTDRCDHFVREYPPEGSVMPFHNPIAREMRNFTLERVVGGNINVWSGPKATKSQVEVAIKAANIYANTYNITELRPDPSSASWQDHECKVFGSMPFMYTCSNRINMLLIECGFENAFVMSGDYLRNWPEAANSESIANHDILFYMCMMMLDSNPNPYAHANTFAHELAHVIQGGFGHSFNTMTEGGATWLEGALMHMPPRPMVYAWGFRDWNAINAAHIYANTKELNARKFYQIHAMFLTYLMQPELLGNAFTSALQNYASFSFERAPWGRGSYDYFLSYMGKPRPTEFRTVDLDVTGVDYPFAEALLNYRVAIVSSCIKDPVLRPSEARYLLPEHVRGRPYWDCSSYPTYFSADGGDVDRESRDMHYGGAAVFRLATPERARVSVASDADPNVRTKVLAAGDGWGAQAEVRELRPGQSVEFTGGAREVFVVQVNVDPKGEVLAPEDAVPLWHNKGLDGWALEGKDGESYPPSVVQGILSPAVLLPAAGDATLHFDAWWAMEAASVDGSSVPGGCAAKGYDAAQVRVHGENGDITVVRPTGGYGTGPGGEAALHAFASEGVYGEDAPCRNFEGWTGSRAPGGPTVGVPLGQFRGQKVRVELLFVSDGSASGRGFFAANISLSGSVVRHLDETMTVRTYTKSPPVAGTAGPTTGVPVVVSYPDGHAPDRTLAKNGRVRHAPWSAAWQQVPTDRRATRRRAYLGWSYSAPVEETKDAFLHPDQEACVLLKAPFTGYLDSATLFTLVDKIGVTSVSLTIRNSSAPYPPLLGYPQLLSNSWGVQDHGMHRFDTGASASLPMLRGLPFLACVGAAAVRYLAADGDLEPFLHLPLTQVPEAGQDGSAGATFLLTPVNATTSGLDPWDGHSITLRAEYVEIPPVDEPNSRGSSQVAAGAPQQKQQQQHLQAQEEAGAAGAIAAFDATATMGARGPAASGPGVFQPGGSSGGIPPAFWAQACGLLGLFALVALWRRAPAADGAQRQRPADDDAAGALIERALAPDAIA